MLNRSQPAVFLLLCSAALAALPRGGGEAMYPEYQSRLAKSSAASR